MNIESTFVIRNNDNGKYVQDMRKSRDEKSYTRFLDRAKTFPTREAALKEKCGNETILSLAEVLGGGA